MNALCHDDDGHYPATTTTNNPASEGGDEDVPVITTSSSVAIYSLPIDQWIQQLQSSSEDNQQVHAYIHTSLTNDITYHL